MSTVEEATTPAELLVLAVGIAESAGQLALDAHGRGREAIESGALHKSSHTDLVTDADRASEQLVRSRIAAARPEDGVLGEEGGKIGGGSGVIWVVDPIDGTTNFVYGLPAWSVSIAVAEASPAPGDPTWSPALSKLLGGIGRVLAGVVHDPSRGETFAASLGGGATLNGLPLRLGPTPVDLAQALVATGFSYQAAARRRQAAMLPEVLAGVRDIRRAGAASLDACYVAAGRLDAYYEAGLEPWDLAAGMLVATEAGASCSAVEDLPPGTPTAVLCRPELGEPLVALLRRAGGHVGSPAGEERGARGVAAAHEHEASEGSGAAVHCFDVFVEIPKGQRNKYELDHVSGHIRLDRTLFTATRYPADYGFIVDTLGLDGDPLDALVLLEEPTFPGCLISCRAIASFEMTDEAGPDAKIICVPERDPRYAHLQDLDDLPPFQRSEIQHFFEEYKALEPGKHVERISWSERDVAWREIADSHERAAKPPRAPAPE